MQDFDADNYKKINAFKEEIEDRSIDKEVGNKIEEINNNLENSIIKSTINEIVFVDMFLEFFYNFAKNKTVSDNNLLLKWIDLAGSAYSEVDVLNRRNKVLFTVPSIYTKSIVISDKLNNGFFNEVANEYNQNIRITQEVANNALINRLANGPKFIDKTKANDPIKMWIRIFKRYSELRLNHPNIRYLSDLDEKDQVFKDEVYEEEHSENDFTF